jgi:hypothetical protein
MAPVHADFEGPYAVLEHRVRAAAREVERQPVEGLIKVGSVTATGAIGDVVFVFDNWGENRS